MPSLECVVAGILAGKMIGKAENIIVQMIEDAKKGEYRLSNVSALDSIEYSLIMIRRFIALNCGNMDDVIRIVSDSIRNIRYATIYFHDIEKLEGILRNLTNIQQEMLSLISK